MVAGDHLCTCAVRISRLAILKDQVGCCALVLHRALMRRCQPHSLTAPEAVGAYSCKLGGSEDDIPPGPRLDRRLRLARSNCARFVGHSTITLMKKRKVAVAAIGGSAVLMLSGSAAYTVSS